MYLSSEGEQLYAYYKHFETDFFKFLKKAKKQSGEKNIHNFRISIKKLKGILKLIELCADQFDAKEHLSPLKKLFKPAGHIRESQVNLIRLHDLSPMDEHAADYITLQQKVIKRERKSFKEKIKNFSPKEITLTRKIIRNYCRVFSKKMIMDKSNAFVHERKTLIRDLLKSMEDVDSIHEIRINLKEITAILGLLNVLKIEGVDSEMLAYLKAYEDDIGLWHDWVILRESLETYLDAHKQDDNTQMRLELALLVEDIKCEEKEFTDSLESFVDGAFDLMSI